MYSKLILIIHRNQIGLRIQISNYAKKCHENFEDDIKVIIGKNEKVSFKFKFYLFKIECFYVVLFFFFSERSCDICEK